MLFMGTTRSAASILGAQRANTETSPETQRRIYAMVTLAQAMRDALYRQDLEAVGDILHAGWLEKQKLAPGISNGRIDEWYCRARDAGAQGGKVLGAGGGGFLLLYAPVDRQQEILAALPELRRIPFSFEPQGTKIIYVED
jgi:D-glycero-alpha-D-manno-heptose-7-phosphate kinase